MNLFYTHLETPVGPFLLAGDGTALRIASFSGGHQYRKPEPDWRADPTAMRFASDQLEQYFAGERTEFDLPLDVIGTPFQKEVWELLRAIPFGETRSYGEIAKAMGRPGASRAVGAANGANVIPLIIPCHRVIGSDTSLTGFGGGLETKRWLLEFEGALNFGRQQPLFDS